MTPSQKASRKYRKSRKGKEAKIRYRSGKKGIAAEREYAWKRQGIKLTYSDYLKMVDICGDMCVLCTEQENLQRKTLHGLKRTLTVDHCHKTGKIRGLLCYKHNLSIDHYADRLPSLLNYLKIDPENVFGVFQ